jgi:hypothetical protein
MKQNKIIVNIKFIFKKYISFCFINFIVSVGLSGSAMFTKALNHGSFIQILPSSKLTSPSLKQITILGWIRPDLSDEGTVLVTAWNGNYTFMAIVLLN